VTLTAEFSSVDCRACLPRALPFLIGLVLSLSHPHYSISLGHCCAGFLPPVGLHHHFVGIEGMEQIDGNAGIAALVVNAEPAIIVPGVKDEHETNRGCARNGEQGNPGDTYRVVPLR
jgi:hypothetical protein